MNDPIVDEVRKIRDEHAASFNYDMKAIFLDIKQREKARGLHFIDGVARQPMPEPAIQPTEGIIPIYPATKSLDPVRTAEI